MASEKGDHVVLPRMHQYLVCFLSLMHYGIVAQDINIAVMPQGYSGDLRQLEILSEQYAQQSGLLTVDVQILQPPDNMQYNQLASSLRCNGTSMVVSTAPCPSPLTDALTSAGLLVLRTASQLHCPLSSDLSSDSLVREYPSSVPRRGVLRHVMETLGWDEVNVFYDDENAAILDEYISVLGHTFSKLRLYHVTRDFGGNDYEHVVRESQTTLLDDALNNNIVLCTPNITQTLLQYAGAHQDSESISRESLFNSRWLGVFQEEIVLEEMESNIQALNNVAVLIMKQQFQTTTTQAIQDVVGMLGTSLDYYLVMTNNTGGLHEEGEDGCSLANTDLLLGLIDLNLDNKLEYKTCSAYRAYVTEYGLAGKHLVPVTLCDLRYKMLTYVDLFPAEKKGFNGRHFIISTIESPPFVYPPVNSSVTDRGGIAMDLLREMANMLNFTYTVVIVPDNQFGVERPDGSWTGMVGVLQRKEADMVFASLTITPARSSVIDLIDYYNEFGGILLKKPDLTEGKWKVIAQPFSWQVWVGVLVSVPVAGLSVWLITLMMRNASGEDVDEFTSFDKSTWYVFGALFTQGGAYEPATTPGRTFIGCWWAFSIVIVASYGGSLIAYLTMAKGDAPFATLEKLVVQDAYKWGLTGGSVYQSEFQKAKGGVYKDAWAGVEKWSKEDPDVLAKSKSVQFDKVFDGHYAFISDRTVLERLAFQDKTCDLVVLPAAFLPMPLGVGLQQNAPYKRVIEKAIRMLQESGMVKFFEQNWKEKDQCTTIAMPEAQPISLLDTQSAFYCLVGGIFFAFCVLVAEGLRYCMCSYVPPEEPEKEKADDGGIHNRPTFGHTLDYAGPSNVHTIYSYSTNYDNGF